MTKPTPVYLDLPKKDKKVFRIVLITIAVIIFLPILFGIIKGFSSSFAPQKMIEKANQQR